MGVRRANESDLEVAHSLLEQLMPAPPGRRQLMWEAALRNANYAAWIADMDGTLAGFLDLFIFPDVAHGSNIGVISNLIIDEAVPWSRAGRDPPASSHRTLQAT